MANCERNSWISPSRPATTSVARANRLAICARSACHEPHHLRQVLFVRRPCNAAAMLRVAECQSQLTV
eukprot:6763751-Lingulodinium_polyedra.AAC.1